MNLFFLKKNNLLIAICDSIYIFLLIIMNDIQKVCCTRECMTLEKNKKYKDKDLQQVKK